MTTDSNIVTTDSKDVRGVFRRHPATRTACELACVENAIGVSWFVSEIDYRRHDYRPLWESLPWEEDWASLGS